MSLGFFELGIVALISLVSCAIPAVALVVAILIYLKLNGFEQTLSRHG